MNPKVRSNLVTLDGEGEFTINTKLRDPDEKPDPALVVDLIRQSVGASIDIEIIEHRPWTAGHALVADRFVSGRIALAGDAVHIFTPTGGFGMNTGVDDAVNLAWKIAAMAAGWGGPNLLASYEIERRPIAFRNTGMAKELSRGGASSPSMTACYRIQRREMRHAPPLAKHSSYLAKSLRRSAFSSAPGMMIHRPSYQTARNLQLTIRMSINRAHVPAAARRICSCGIGARCSIISEPASPCFTSAAITICR